MVISCGLSWFDETLIFPNSSVKESLIQLIYSELHKYFNEQFIRNYDRQKHFFYFTLDVEFNQESCELLSCKVSKEKDNEKTEKIKLQPGYEHKAQFIIKTLPNRNKKNQVIIRYNPTRCLHKNDCVVCSLNLVNDNIETIGEIGDYIICDWWGYQELYNNYSFYLDPSSRERLAKKFEELFAKIIKSDNPNEKHVYYFEIKMKFYNWEIEPEITSYFVKDIRKDTSFYVPVLSDITTIPRERLLENEEIDYIPPKQDYSEEVRDIVYSPS